MQSKFNQVYIVGGFDSDIAVMFMEYGYRGTRDITMADVVVFTGGADINPELYHEQPIPAGIHFNTNRDAAEVEAFNNARNLGIPMIGICRGAQMLNVLSGGRLWQDVDNHTKPHYIRDLITNEITLVTSTHHQQMRPHPTGTLVAVATHGEGVDLSSIPSLCTFKEADGHIMTAFDDVNGRDAEVVWYPQNRALCFQPHPEIRTAHSTRKYFWSLFDRYLQPTINEAQTA